MPLLCLRLLSEAVQEEEGWSLAVQWLLQGEDGGRRGGGVTDYRGLKDLLDPHQDWIHDPANVLLLVPHDQLLEISVSVPGRNAGQMRRALPYAVEEFTTADVDSLHIASEVLRAGHPTRCQLIDKMLLENWLACLRSLGVEAGYLHTDTEMLPVADGEVFVLVDGPSALIRTATEAATVDRVNLLLALQTLAPASVRIAGGALTDLESAQLPETRIEQLADGGDVMAFLLAAWRRGQGINLLQGAYAPARQDSPLHRQLWSVAAVAGMWALVAWVLMIGEGFWSSHRAQVLEQEARDVYSSIFPDDRNVRNVKRSLAARLGRAVADNDTGFVQLSADFAAALEGATLVRSLEFDRQTGELRTEVLLPDHGKVEALGGRLKQAGVENQLLNATQDKEQVRAYFLLRSAS
ncbi:MAG: hypothetical protein H6993_17625 [Pseudomonadales bacterium]|nr:hypothetical protein [Pseudomonadales bacterium]MCP5185788.1 hypothetical protein [Pseudomonadales bacterium]